MVLLSFHLYSQKNIEEFKAVTLKKDTIDVVTDHKTTVFIFSNDNSCRDCFIPLNKENLNSFIKPIEPNLNIEKIVFICRTANGSRAKRNFINRLKIDLPNIANDSNIIFDIYNEDYQYNQMPKTGIFGRYKINKTPAFLIYTSSKKEKLIPYEKFMEITN